MSEQFNPDRFIGQVTDALFLMLDDGIEVRRILINREDFNALDATMPCDPAPEDWKWEPNRIWGGCKTLVSVPCYVGEKIPRGGFKLFSGRGYNSRVVYVSWAMEAQADTARKGFDEG